LRIPPELFFVLRFKKFAFRGGETVRKHPTNRTWKSEDLEKLRHFAESGVSPARAAAHFKRSIAAIQNKARLEGFPFPDRRDIGGGPPWKIARVST
jgi:hypothetical protein